MNVKIELDPKSVGIFNHNLQRMIAINGKPIEDTMRQQARLLTRELARFTGRRGLPKEPKRHATDIRQTVKSLYNLVDEDKWMVDWIKSAKPSKTRKGWGEKAAQRLENHIKRGNVKSANNIIERATGIKDYFKKWDKGEAHKKWKKNPKGVFEAVNLIGDPKQNRKRLRTYYNKEIRKIGNAKAGWARAIENLGGVKQPLRDIPKWAKKKQHRAHGGGNIKGTGYKTVVTLVNRVKYGVTKRTLRDAYKRQGTNIKKQIEKMYKSNWRNIQKALRSGVKSSNPKASQS